MDNGHIGPPCEQTDICENITFPQLRGQEVIVLALHILLLVGDFWLIVEFQRFTSIFLSYHFVTHETVITARKRSLRRLCFYRCVSVHGGGGYPSMPCRSHDPAAVYKQVHC